MHYHLGAIVVLIILIRFHDNVDPLPVAILRPLIKVVCSVVTLKSLYLLYRAAVTVEITLQHYLKSADAGCVKQALEMTVTSWFQSKQKINNSLLLHPSILHWLLSLLSLLCSTAWVMASFSCCSETFKHMQVYILALSDNLDLAMNTKV